MSEFISSLQQSMLHPSASTSPEHVEPLRDVVHSAGLLNLSSAPHHQATPYRAMAQTIGQSATCEGIGLHSGQSVRLTIHPCDKPTGIQFYLRGERIPALWNLVREVPLCTMLISDQGTKISTLEHLMAALYSQGIDHAVVELSNHEVPILDGSSRIFVDLIKNAGWGSVHHHRQFIRILKPVTVTLADGRSAGFLPSDHRIFDFHLDFSTRGLPAQFCRFNGETQSFDHDIAPARTFGFYEDVEAIQERGMAKGGSLDNAVVFYQGQAMNPTGLRFDDEPVRHKILDAMGDLYLAGSPILGHYVGHNAGHAMNHQLLEALFKDSDAWRLESADHG